MQSLIENLYFAYNPDLDFGGNYGIKIAEIIFRKCNYNLKTLKNWIEENKKILENIVNENEIQ